MLLMFVTGVDGCHAGWVAFKVELPSLVASVEVIDLPSWLRNRPPELACLGIDIPIGLLDRPRRCDIEARERLGWPRRASVFPALCRDALTAKTHAEASTINRRKTERGLSQQAFHIGSKIKQVDDAITPDIQQWAFEVHPEVCFWKLNSEHPMQHNKKTEPGRNERLNLLRTEFPDIRRHLDNKPQGVGKDDLLDAAVAAWTALRRHRGEASCVSPHESDEKRLEATIWY
jgi:predicted RNase H-like nuclease